MYLHTHRLAIFSSGKGSNAEAIFRVFATQERVQVGLLVCNNSAAPVLKRAMRWSIPTLLFSNTQLKETPHALLHTLQQYNIHFIALAGFIRLLPPAIVRVYSGRIFNIHPSLLPKYGGKGMYGLRVHKAVLANKETESGISIHEVNELYDQGALIFQARFPIPTGDPPATLRWLTHKIAELEHAHYPKILAQEIHQRAEQ